MYFSARKVPKAPGIADFLRTPLKRFLKGRYPIICRSVVIRGALRLSDTLQEGERDLYFEQIPVQIQLKFPVLQFCQALGDG